MSEKRAKIVFLSIGSNLGEKSKNIELVKFNLEKNNIKIIKSSKNYETLSWPDKKQPTFINIALKIRTYLSPQDLIKKCLYIEKKLGRLRNRKNEPRICDIDIIDYDKMIVKGTKRQNLTIPHPEMHKRNFVLLPLFEIAKTWIHPSKKVSIKELINALDPEDLRTIKLI